MCRYKWRNSSLAKRVKIDMAYFSWKDEYRVGVIAIDSQHQRLVSYLNDLYEAMEAGTGREKVIEILDGLIVYTKLHFKTEEEL